MDLSTLLYFILVFFLLSPPVEPGCQNISLSLNNRQLFPDHYFTATSKYSTDYQPTKARFDSSRGWAPRTNGASEYLQIDLGALFKICAVATRGNGKNNGEWVSQYKLSFSSDNFQWEFYKENNIVKLFNGNSDRSSAVKSNILVTARFVRFQPTTYSYYKVMRVEIYGTPEDCKQPLKIGNRGIGDTQMKSSSDLDNSHTASRGRLFGDNSWCSSTASNTEYLQVDLGEVITMTGIATQGDKTTDKWVQSYTIRYSDDESQWQGYIDQQSSLIVLQGNTNKNGIRVNWFNTRILARYIRVIAQTWSTAICMRIELYGCDKQCDSVAVGLESRVIQDSQMNASSQYNTSNFAYNGRLHYTGGPSWCASTSDPSPYLEIDLGSPYVICAVATQGNYFEKQWTKSYFIKGSINGAAYVYYGEDRVPRKEFEGNFDQNTVVKYSLSKAFLVRYLRFQPVIKYGVFCIRAEIYGKPQSVCQNSAVGIRSLGGIPDHRMTASSEYSSTYAIIYGRLYSSSSWAARTNNDVNDYLQIDLGAEHVLCALATQGSSRSSEWTRTYNISLSSDGVTWKIYQENGAQKVFVGNTDKHTVVKQTMTDPTVAKFIRFYPKTFTNHKQMRVEVYGLIKECRSPLGVERFMGVDPLTQLSSSSHSDAGHSASNARLYGKSSWCTTNTVNQYIQLDLLSPMSVTGVATQGDPAGSSTKWVRTYDVHLGFATSKWFLIKGIQGNTDRKSVVTQWFRKPMGARYVRILPKTWSNSICLRIDVYGCKQVAPPDIYTVETITNQTATIGSHSELSCSVHALSNVRVAWRQGQVNLTSSAHISYQNGFAKSVLRPTFTNADDYTFCTKPGSSSRSAFCSKLFTCEAYYDNLINGETDSKDVKVFVELDVPAALTGFTVGKILDNSAFLTWNQPPSLTAREGTINLYQVEYNVDGAQRVDQDIVAADSTSHTIGGLLPNTSYVVKLRAVSHVGESAWVTERFRTVPTILCEDRSLGMEIELIPNYYITASSQKNNSTLPRNARLNKASGSPWCSATDDSAPYLQIDLGTPHVICAVATQGNQIEDEWVTSYSLLLSDDGINWKYFLQQDRDKVFSGNTDRNTVVKHALNSRVVGRFIRFVPRTHRGDPCMRVELYGRQAQKECADISVGLASLNTILDHRFTASSTYSSAYLPQRARLGNANSWASKTNTNPNDFLQIDLGTVYRICAVATLGNGAVNERTTKYKLILSLDNLIWNVYKVNGGEMVFPGNTNRNILVKNQLTEAASARFVRFNPTAYFNHKTLRVEVYGVPHDCKEPLGIENRGVDDNQMTSSSDLDNSHTASRGRLYGDNSWCSSTSSNTKYLQVDLGQVKTVTGIATQGDKTVNKWVKTYAVSYSTDSNVWVPYTAGKTIRKVLRGNSDKSSVTVNWLSYPFEGRYVRILPLTWNAGACVRFDLYGCSVGCDNLAMGLQQGLVPDSRITASSQYNTSTTAHNGRLHYTGGSSWCASTSDPSPYLQIDLGAPHIICAVATQGDYTSDRFVETYQIQGSTDGSSFTNYGENGLLKTFAGNFDRKSMVKHIFKGVFIAQYVKFMPKSYNVLPCMRVEIYGSTQSACAGQPVGQRIGSSIKDYRISASSVYSASFPINSARLYAPRAWATKRLDNINDFVQVDLGSVYLLCAVATQGSPTTDEWVKSYKMSISPDGKTWSFYNESGSARTFIGNTDKNTVVKRTLANVVSARFVRIYPVTYHNHKDLRFEMYGIKQAMTVPLGLETGSLPDNRLSASSSNLTQTAAHARLYGVSSWCKSITSSGQSYLQVDLWAVMQISGIATQGNPGNNAWVTSYDLHFSYSTSVWQKRQGFQGNTDKNGLVIQMFNEPVSARYLRLLPQASNVLSCLRIEIYGNKIVAKPEILSLTPSKTILASKGSWEVFQCEVKAQSFVTILWLHNNKRLPSNSSVATYSGGTTVSILTLNYTNGDAFASACHEDDNPSNQASNCTSIITCQAFYIYLLTEGSDKRDGKVYVRIKVPLAPVNVTFFKIRHHSVEMHWSANPLTIDRASVKSYYIQYYPVSLPSQFLNKTLRANRRMTHIGGLEANTSYVVQIRAVSIAGKGSWTTKNLTTKVEFACSKKSIGLEDRTIPDVYITSSSVRNNSTREAHARLMHSSSWCASTSDSSPYLQLDLGSTHVVCAVATQGNPLADEWVTSYELHYSRDGSSWRPVLESNNVKTFSGNQDRSLVNVHEIKEQLEARIVRFVPKTFNGSACMRVDLYGEPYHPGCAEIPVGVQSPSYIPDYRFTASSYHSTEHKPSNARPGGDSTWRPKHDDNQDDYLQIDLGTIYTLCGIKTERQSLLDGVQSYIVYYSLDNQEWDVLVDLRGIIKVFSVGRTTLVMKISARFVRIFPRKFTGHKSLRVQMYGVDEVCKGTLGIENKGVENIQLTSLSHLDSSHAASRGRLYGDTSWCSAASSLAEYIQIDLRRVKTIRGIASQGDHVMDKWVKTYTVSYSIDGNAYEKYTGGKAATKIFHGNTDRSGVVVNWIRYPIVASYVRVYPQAWNDAICLRVDLYGCQETCSDLALGLENRMIQDSQITASSQYSISSVAQNGRLHYTGGPSWCASTSDPSPYLQIDLGAPHIICAVATQGDHLADQWVEKYKVMGSLDGRTWDNEMEFKANSDSKTVVKHEMTVAMTARFIKLLSQRSYGNACMRVELYGTTLAGCSKEPIGIRWGGRIRDHRITASSNNGPAYLPKMARLDGPSGWSPRTTTNRSDFLQVDLGSVYMLCCVATQGGGGRSQWTKSYTVTTSLDGSNWKTYQTNNIDKVFSGNTDNSAIVKHTLDPVVAAKFVRLYPITYNGYKELRVELYGEPYGFRQSLGVETGRIQDSQLSSPNLNLSNPTTVRLYSESAWSSNNDADSFLQIDLVDAKLVTGIATQGRSFSDSWVNSYDVKFGFSTKFWYQMRNFKGNTDDHGVVVNWLEQPIGAVFVRISPKKSVSYMRVDLYGSEGVASPRVLVVSQDTNLTAIPGSAVTITCSIYGEPFTMIRWSNRTHDITSTSSKPSHDDGQVFGNVSVLYTSAEMIHTTYECQRINRTVRCYSTFTCTAYYGHFPNNGFDERSIRVFIDLALPDAPTKPTTSNMNSTSVTITWTRPDPGDGSILSYRVKYRKYGSNLTRMANSTSGNSTQSVRLTGLKPYTQYLVSVIPLGSIGVGLQSPSRTFITYLRSSIYVPSIEYILHVGQMNASLLCYGQGYPLPNVTWTKDGLPVSYSQQFDTMITETNVSSRLTLANESGVTYQEAGNYTCHVANHVDGMGPINSIIEVIFTPEVKVTPTQAFSVEGTTVIIECEIAGVPLPVITWSYNDGQLPNNTQIKNNSLVIKNIVNTVANEGTYTCMATSRAGVARSSANLTVWVLPKILQPLKNITLMVGSTLNMTCAVSGEPLPNVAWIKDNSSNLTGVEYSERKTRLVVRSVTVRDEGVYVCNASSKAGWSISRAFVSIKATEEVFLSKPYTRLYIKNQTNITVTCYGRGYPKPSIIWLQNNKTIPIVESLSPNDTNRVVQVIQDRISEPLDNVSSRLYLRTAGIVYDDAGNYSCRVSNGVGVIPAEKTLEVLFVPEFTIVPQNQIVVLGSHVVFTCAASGVPSPRISWLFNGEPTQHNVNNGNLLFTAAYNNRSFEGNYSCVARSRAGEDRRTIRLYVDELPKVSRIQGNTQVELETNLTLNCVVTGDPIPFIYWMKDGSRDIPNAVIFNANRTLFIDSMKLSAIGVYRCVAWNRAGNDSMDINITALAYPKVHIPPPYLRAYLLGQTNITIECKGSGYPTPIVRWKKGNDVIPFVDFWSANDSGRVVQVPLGNISNPLHNVTSVLYLRTRGIMYSDAGNYTCEVINAASPNLAHETVEVLFKPEFDFTSKDKIVLAGNDVTFSCLASGVPKPSIEWKFNGGNVSVPHWRISDTNITILYVENNDQYEGNYTCKATSRAGIDRHTARLVVDVPSRILNISGSTNVMVNTAINLTCAVEGDPYPNVYWEKDGLRNNSGALYFHDKRNLIVRHAQIRDEGEYQCMAENRAGKDNKTVDVYVLVPPSVYISRSSPTIFRRGVVNQSIDCYGYGYPKPKISWSRSDVIIPFVLDITSNDTNRVFQIVGNNISQPLQNLTSRLYLRTAGVTYAEAGNYSCRVSNNVSTALSIVEVLFFPIIDVAPSDQTVNEGSNISFTCQSSGVPHPSVTWLFNGQAISWNHTVEEDSLMLWNVRNGVYEGNYTCLATSRAGQASQTAYLVINVPPRIVQVSGNRTYLINTKITLTCHVTGDPVPSVSWTRPGNKPIRNAVLSNSNRTLVIDKASLEDEGRYQCIAINRAGNTSYQVFITIQALVTLYVPPPTRRSYLQRDQNVTIDCYANGYPRPSINWWFNGRPVPTVDDVYPNHTSQVVQVTWDNISEKLENVTSRLYIRSSGITLSDAGNYTCNASNGVGEGPQVQWVEILFRPEIQAAPQSITVLENTNVSFFCNATGVPSPVLTWSFSEGRVRSTDITANNLVVPHVQNTDSFEGVYSCNASNIVGTTSASAQLTIHTIPKMTILLQASIIIERGTTANLTCQSHGDPEPAYRWYKSGQLISQGYDLINGNKTLLLSNVTTKDDGRYTCEAYNIEGNDTTSTNLTVHASPVFIQTLPKVSGIIVNKTIQLSCSAESIPPPNVTWLRHGRLITNDTSGRFVVQTNGTFVKISTLSIKHVRYVDRGTYECMFSNYRGVVNTSTTLEVYVPPRVVQVSGNRTYLINTKITLTCHVTGDPVPSVSWTRPGNKPIRNAVLSNSNRTLVIDKASLEDEGRYQCIAINRAGNTSYHVFITIQALVTLYVPPPTRRSYLQRDQNVTIDCYANGYPRPSINWWFNGRPVPAVDDVYPNHTSQVVQVTWDNISEKLENVTSRLYIRSSGITLSDAGNYTCNASNGVGEGPQVQSVEILFRPEIQAAPQSITVLENTNISFFCNATGVPSPRLIWSFSEGRVRSTDITANNLVVPHVQNTDSFEGVYSCNASNIVGTTSASAQLTIHTIPKMTILLQASIIIERGTTANLTCQSHGDPEPAYRWYKSGQLISQGYDLINGNKTLLLSNVTTKDDGRYTCEAYNIEGNDTTSTNLTVHAAPVLLQTLPKVSGIIVNKTIQLSCSAESIPPPNVTWLRHGRLITNDTSGRFVVQTNGTFLKVSTLTIKHVRYIDRGTYECMFSNYRGVINTSTTLEVYVPPVILTPLTDRTYPKGSTMNLTCEVSGKSYPIVYWLKSGSPDIPRAQLSNRNTTLIINDLKFEDRGEYQCFAVNKGGNDSSLATIVITVPTSVEIYRPFTRVYSRGLTKVNITCYAIGFPKPNLEWRRYGARVLVVPNITESNEYGAVQVIRNDLDGEEGLLKRYSVLYLRPAGITYGEAGNYTCVANRSIDGASAQKTVEVLFEPEFDVTPRSQNVTQGSNVSFFCHASGVPSPKITWFFNGKQMRVYRDTLRISNVKNTQEYEGMYTCRAASRAGSSNYTAYLDVDVVPVITDIIGNTTVLFGSKINLTCLTEGDPLPRVLWKKDGSIISHVNISYDANNLVIEEAVFDDRGIYQCIALNRAGNTTRQVRMTILVPPKVYVTPPFTRVFKQKLTNVFMNCYGNGHPQPSVHWSIGSNVIAIVSRMTSYYSNSTVQVVSNNISHPLDNVTSRLYLRNAGLTLDEAGNYSCSAVNGVGLPSIKTVEVLFFPEFQVTPTSKVVLEGNDVLFKCKITGVPRPGVTWYFSGGSLPNKHTIQGSNLLIPNVTNNPTYEGNYTCVGASKVGSVNYTAHLIIHVLPFMVVTLNDTLVQERGHVVTLTCKATGDPEPAYLWTKDGLILKGSNHVRFLDNHRGLAIINVTTQDNGVYKCLAYNVEGNVSTTTNLTVHATVSMIQNLPAKTEIIERQSLSLSCKAESIPLPSVVWYRNGREIQNGEDSRLKIQTRSSHTTLTSTLSLQSIKFTDRGDYSCVFSNYRGTSRSIGRVTVQVPPAIILPPFSISALLNGTIIFNCTVRGYPTPRIAWFKGSVSLSQSNRVKVSIMQKNGTIKMTSYLNILKTVREDTDVYSCNATNVIGITARTASLTILEKPDRPVLSVVSTTSTTALLRWYTTFNGNSAIRYYTISYNSSEGSSSVNVTGDQTKEHEFIGLLPATLYVFMITASNDIGTSTATVSDAKTLESVPWQPRNVYSQSLSSTSIFINWTIPTRTNGDLTRYVIFLRRVNQSQEMNYTVLPSLTRLTLYGLMPYTYYEGEVQAFTKIGGGNRSATFDQVLTFEDVPDAPRRLRATQSTSTSITLSWTRPTTMNGILRLYQITIRRDMSNSTMSLNVTQDIMRQNVTHTVTGLRPFTVYNITVFAVTIDAGNGSNTIIYSTNEDRPGQPHNVQSTFDGEFYTVTWYTPLTPNGIIVGYKVLFQLDRTVTVDTDIQDKEFIVEGKETNRKVKLSDLNGDKSYVIRVQARTSKGYGRISTSFDSIRTPITDPPQPEIPSETPEVTKSTAIINIPKFSDANGKIKYYSVINVVIPPGKQGQLKDPESYTGEGLVSYCVAHQSNSPAAYLAFRFNSEDYDKYKVFVLGEGQGTKCSMRMARASNTPFYNGPLRANTEYMSFTRGYTSEKTFAQTGYFGFTTKRKSPGTGGDTSLNLIIGVLIAIILAVIIVISLYCYRRKRNTPRAEEERELQQMGQNDDALYDNVDEGANVQQLPIPVDDLKSHYLRMHSDSDHLFDQEYKSIQDPLGVTTTKCDLPINKQKNRYGNIKAYDHSRVVLSTVEGEPGSDYINANYIDGYNKKNHYIATIGPKPTTSDDFWRMVWEQKSSIIVMLTRPEENGKVKCHRYWPDAESSTFDRITVTLEETEELADFEIRTFSLQMLSQPQHKPRKVTHFFFTSWPDHDVPDYATGLLEFWKRVKKYQSICHEKGPMIVHCSAGVGRTGTFIVIDAMMDQIKAEGELDVYNYVTRIRSQRNYMVQKGSQYAFIHYALLEAVTFGHTEIDVQDLRTKLANLEKHCKQTEMTGLEHEFEMLNGVVQDETYDFKTAVQPRNAKKNRFSNVLPFDRTRVTLSPILDKDDCTYINASYLEGYQEKNAYIATQAPLENTITDFWRMVWETEVYSIVMLCTLEDPSEVPYVQYWPEKDSNTYGSLLVEKRNQEQQTDLIIREFNVTNTETGEVRKILHFNYLDWPEHRQPTSLLSLIDLIGAVQKARRQHAHRPIVIHCSNGIGRTGAFCTLFTSLERVKLEGYLDVFITARMLRTQRSGMVETLDQYRMCYHAILAYLDSFEESQYQNFM